MYSKAVKEEVAVVLKRILKQKSIEDIHLEIDEISDEYRIDLTEPEPEEDDLLEEAGQYLEDDEIEDMLGNGWDDDDDEF